jgi:hypothetical protein
MLKRPYAVQYLESAPTDEWFTHYLNKQWKEGWEYVAHLTVPGPKQALLMKMRNYPEPQRVIAALMSLWGDKHMTTDELFAKCTAILSDDPSELPAIRAALGEGQWEGSTRSRFEEWLQSLRKDRPAIAMSSGKYIEISDELLAVLEEEAQQKKEKK